MYDRHLDTFLEVADCGSFLKASEKLYVSANAVTKQINLLESDLGVKLFQRRGPCCKRPGSWKTIRSTPSAWGSR